MPDLLRSRSPEPVHHPSRCPRVLFDALLADRSIEIGGGFMRGAELLFDVFQLAGRLPCPARGFGVLPEEKFDQDRG